MVKGFYLFFLLSMLLGNPLMAIIVVFIVYMVLDRAFLRILPDFGAIFRRNSRIKALRNELSINNSNAAVAKELGILYFEKKKYNNTIEMLTQAKERIEGSPELFSYLGMAMMEAGREEEGGEYLNKAIAIDKKTAYGLPYVYLLGYELKKSTSSNEKIIELEHNVQSFSNVENLYKMANKYKQAGNRDKYIELLKLALKEYSYCPRNLKKLHRKWAVLARLKLTIKI